MTEADSTGDLLRETARRVFAEHCGTAVSRAADGGAQAGTWPAGAWAAVEEAGLHRALLPEASGGYGVAVTDALSLARVAAEFAAPLPLAETMIAHFLLAAAGLDVPDGPLTVAPVVAGETLSLTREGAGVRVRGTVTRVPWGRDAVAAVVLATDGTENWVALLPRAAWTWEGGQNVAREPRDTLTIDGLAIGAARCGVDAGGLRAIGAALRAQQIAGALTAMTAMTVQYAQDRVQFGRPIGKFQAVQQNLAVLAGQTAAAVAAADMAAEAIADGLKILPIAAAKARCGEAASIGAGIAHQVHGAIGFTFEHGLQFLTRRLWSWRDEFGNDASWNRVVGRHMAAAGGERLWAEIVAA
jgi:acyl-CoA dehydrogenase